MNKSAYVAIGAGHGGYLSTLWACGSPRRKAPPSGLKVCSNLANRGVKDVFIVCCDGLTGLADAVEATWPDSMVQTCVVHLIRAANRWVSFGDRKPVSKALRAVYTAPDEASAHAALEEFAASDLGQKYPQSVKVWRDAWDRNIAVPAVPAGSQEGHLHHQLY